jgi:hypothetical protein
MGRAALALIATACSFEPAPLPAVADATPGPDGQVDAMPDAAPDAVWPESACWSDAGFTLTYGEHRYRYGTNHRGFDGARIDECEAAQAYLVLVEDAGENAFLDDLTDSEDPWIGLRDDVTEGVFHWVRDGGAGPPLTGYTNWDSGEPNNQFDNEDCVHFWGSGGTWNDEACSDARAYVCECQRFRAP